jgi:hypothetical protein
LGKRSANSIRRYPADIECEAVKKEFVDDVEFLDQAIKDKPHTLAYHGRGVYQCWCDTESKKNDIQDETAFCYTFWSDKLKGAIIQKVIALSIVVMNIVIQVLCQIMTRKIGFHSYNREILRSCILIFVGQFINFSFVQMIANAHFTNTPLEFINKVGNFHDLTPEFYS